MFTLVRGSGYDTAFKGLGATYISFRHGKDAMAVLKLVSNFAFGDRHWRSWQNHGRPTRRGCLDLRQCGPRRVGQRRDRSRWRRWRLRTSQNRRKGVRWRRSRRLRSRPRHAAGQGPALNVQQPFQLYARRSDAVVATETPEEVHGLRQVPLASQVGLLCRIQKHSVEQLLNACLQVPLQRIVGARTGAATYRRYF